MRSSKGGGEKSLGLWGGADMILVIVLMFFSSHSLDPLCLWLLQRALLLPDRGDSRHRADPA